LINNYKHVLCKNEKKENSLSEDFCKDQGNELSQKNTFDNVKLDSIEEHIDSFNLNTNNDDKVLEKRDKFHSFTEFEKDDRIYDLKKISKMNKKQGVESIVDPELLNKITTVLAPKRDQYLLEKSLNQLKNNVNVKSNPDLKQKIDIV